MSREKIKVYEIPMASAVASRVKGVDDGRVVSDEEYSKAWDRAIAVNKIIGIDNLTEVTGATAGNINRRLKRQTAGHVSDKFDSVDFRLGTAEQELDGAIERSERVHFAAEIPELLSFYQTYKQEQNAASKPATETKVISREVWTPDPKVALMNKIVSEEKWIASKTNKKIVKSTDEYNGKFEGYGEVPKVAITEVAKISPIGQYNGGDVDPEMRFVDSKSTDVVPVIVESKPIKLEENIETVLHTTQIDRITQETGPDLKTLPEKFNGLIDPEKMPVEKVSADLNDNQLIEALEKAWDRMAPTDIHDEDIFGRLGNKLSIIFTDLKNKWQNWVNNRQVSIPVNSAEGQIKVLKTEIIAAAETVTELTDREVRIAERNARRGNYWTVTIPARTATVEAKINNGWTGPRLNGVDRDNYITALMTTVADRDAKLKARDERRGKSPMWIPQILADNNVGETHNSLLTPAMTPDERSAKIKQSKKKKGSNWRVVLINNVETNLAVPQNDQQQAFLRPKMTEEERKDAIKRVREKRDGEGGWHFSDNNLATS